MESKVQYKRYFPKEMNVHNLVKAMTNAECDLTELLISLEAFIKYREEKNKIMTEVSYHLLKDTYTKHLK